MHVHKEWSCARVDIQCPANQSLKDCVDAASTLIDKVMRMGPPPGAPKPPANGAKEGGERSGGKAPTDKAPGDKTPGPPDKQL